MTLHGTDTEERLEALAHVASTLQAALASLASIRPNGRDYATADLDAALAAHASRLERVGAVKAEIEAEIEALGVAW